MIRIALIVLVSFLVACVDDFQEVKARKYAPPPISCHRTFTVSTQFDVDERAAIARAASRWNAIAIEQFCLVDGEEQDTRYIFPYSAGSDPNGAIGLHWQDTDRIGLLENMGLDTLELVALHEFGHAHGIGHLPAPSIMHAGIGTAWDFTDIDIAECMRLNVCEEQ